jgi:hypothetical protein
MDETNIAIRLATCERQIRLMRRAVTIVTGLLGISSFMTALAQSEADT